MTIVHLQRLSILIALVAASACGGGSSASSNASGGTDAGGHGSAAGGEGAAARSGASTSGGSGSGALGGAAGADEASGASGEAGSVTGEGGDPGTARGPGECAEASQCPELGTSPVGCAEPSCVSGRCVYLARDQDGDGFEAARCLSQDPHLEVSTGDDCDDTDPETNPNGWDGPAGDGHADACNDGIDQDCSGVVDDEKLANSASCQCTPGAHEPCAATPDGVALELPLLDDAGLPLGECHFGMRECDSTGSWGACLGAKGPVPETCNGLNDDCDLDTDENAVDAHRFYCDADGDGIFACVGYERACAPSGACPGDWHEFTDAAPPADEPPSVFGDCDDHDAKVGVCGASGPHFDRVFYTIVAYRQSLTPTYRVVTTQARPARLRLTGTAGLSDSWSVVSGRLYQPDGTLEPAIAVKNMFSVTNIGAHGADMIADLTLDPDLAQQNTRVMNRFFNGGYIELDVEYDVGGTATIKIDLQAMRSNRFSLTESGAQVVRYDDDIDAASDNWVMTGTQTLDCDYTFELSSAFDSTLAASGTFKAYIVPDAGLAGWLYAPPSRLPTASERSSLLMKVKHAPGGVSLVPLDVTVAAADRR